MGTRNAFMTVGLRYGEPEGRIAFCCSVLPDVLPLSPAVLLDPLSWAPSPLGVFPAPKPCVGYSQLSRCLVSPRSVPCPLQPCFWLFQSVFPALPSCAPHLHPLPALRRCAVCLEWVFCQQPDNELLGLRFGWGGGALFLLGRKVILLV